MNIKLNLESNPSVGFYALYASLRFFKEFKVKNHSEPNSVNTASAECYCMLEDLKDQYPKEYAEARDEYNSVYKDFSFKKDSSFIELEKERAEWALKQFPDATVDSCLKHLKKEIKEIESDLFNKTLQPFEYVDAIMLIFDAANRVGISADDIELAYAEKLAMNKSRVWVKNIDCTYSHVKHDKMVENPVEFVSHLQAMKLKESLTKEQKQKVVYVNRFGIYSTSTSSNNYDILKSLSDLKVMNLVNRGTCLTGSRDFTLTEFGKDLAKELLK